MIKHIALFKLKEAGSAEAQLSKLEGLKAELEALINKVDTLRFIEVGINCNPDEEYHLALNSEFDDLDGVKAYAVHPDHVAVGKKIREVLEKRACVDYEF